MRAFNILGFLLVSVSLLSCSSTGGIITFPLKGTNTAAVRIVLDENKMPQVLEETVVVAPGQRVVWVGPEDFSIRFPKGSPFNLDDTNNNSKAPKTATSAHQEAIMKPITFTSKEAVITLQVPKELQQFFPDEKERISFKYDVIVDGQVLDPELIIIWK